MPESKGPAEESQKMSDEEVDFEGDEEMEEGEEDEEFFDDEGGEEMASDSEVVESDDKSLLLLKQDMEEIEKLGHFAGVPLLSFSDDHYLFFAV